MRRPIGVSPHAVVPRPDGGALVVTIVGRRDRIEGGACAGVELGVVRRGASAKAQGPTSSDC